MKPAMRMMFPALGVITAWMVMATPARADVGDMTPPAYSLDHGPRHPRSRPVYRSDQPAPRVYKEIHAGFQNPDGDPATETLLGFRIAALVDPHIGIGGMVDWSHRGETITQVVSSQPGPGGTTIITQREFARASADLVPVLAFLHISGDNARPVIPYGGLGGGLELLFLSAEDFRTGAQYDATFAGWGWQAWGGVAIPLSARARFNAEVFRNVGELTRDTDESSGSRVRETVDVDAIGMRFGIAFGF